MTIRGAHSNCSPRSDLQTDKLNMPTPHRNDAVEFESLKCAICFKILEYMSISQREAHYEHHFVNDLVEDSVTKAQGSSCFRSLW